MKKTIKKKTTNKAAKPNPITSSYGKLPQLADIWETASESLYFIGPDANGKNHKVSKEIYDYVCKNSTDSYNDGRRDGIILSVLVGVILAVGVALLMQVT